MPTSIHATPHDTPTDPPTQRAQALRAMAMSRDQLDVSNCSQPLHFQASGQIMEKLASCKDVEEKSISAPPVSGLQPPQDDQQLKRKRTSEDLEEHASSKRLRQLGGNCPSQTSKHDSVAHWVDHSSWPDDYGEEYFVMENGNGSDETSNNKSSKRTSDSTHRSSLLERMAANGVFMKSSALVLRSSKDLCARFLQGSHEPVCLPFPRQQLPAVLERVDSLNEGRVQRDVTPWVVPSAENLFYNGELGENWIGDEVQAEWRYCTTIGSTRPKPDYTAGLLRNAFTKDEIERLRKYSSPERPFLFTPELSFPFLICEVKSGEEGLPKADRQNVHSASIAVRAIIELYKAAFGKSAPDRVQELYGQVLVFTVSHNPRSADVYGHYAVLSEESAEKLEFYRYHIANSHFTLDDGINCFKTYNFVFNVYKNFAKEHRQRIKEAAAHLKSPSTSETGIQDTYSLPDSQIVPPQDETSERSGGPASTLQTKQKNRMVTQMQQKIDSLQSESQVSTVTQMQQTINKMRKQFQMRQQIINKLQTQLQEKQKQEQDLKLQEQDLKLQGQELKLQGQELKLQGQERLIEELMEVVRELKASSQKK